jgi:asparagine synthase (glutamine-hydrolysing)
MFAFAIWDVPRQRLFVARDRVGIKPLYFCQTHETIWFASEIKALLMDDRVPREICLPSIDSFLSYHYCPGPHTMFRDIHRLLPGHAFTVENGSVRFIQYWDLVFPEQPASISFDDAADELRDLLRRRVEDHMMSDVPVGFLASGGVDSTALLGFAVQQTARQIQTFTVGFEEEGFADERPYARLAAERFGTRHHEISISAQQFREYLPAYVWQMEDPVCEPPAIALHYVSKLAREHVKVLLSGEGGDEAFGGYPNYPNQLLLERLKSICGPLRSPVGAGLSMFRSAPGLRRFAGYGNLLPLNLRDHYQSRTSTPFSHFNASKAELYSDSFRLASPTKGEDSYFDVLFRQIRKQDVLGQMLYIDTKTWLPDDLLIKADKITMGNSVELRVPLLDHDVLEFAARLPSSYKVKGMQTKRVLKRAFRGLVPEQILKRKKTGFPVPYERWLRKDLQEYVRETICSERALGRGYFNRRGIEKLLHDDASNRGDMKRTFCLLVLELWHKRFVDRPIHQSSRAEMPIAA